MSVKILFFATLFFSGLRNGGGGVTVKNYRSTDVVNYRKTDTVGQNTALRQFSKTNKTKPDNRNQYQNKIANNFSENDLESGLKTNFFEICR